MASLYKKPIFARDPKTGQRVKAKSKKWWGRFRDHLGVEHRMPSPATGRQRRQCSTTMCSRRNAERRDALIQWKNKENAR